jgi:hypothetical protein
MNWRERLKSWILADPEQSTLYAALDLELSRREPWRLDTRDGVLDDPCRVHDIRRCTICLPDDGLTPEEREEFYGIVAGWEKP